MSILTNHRSLFLNGHHPGYIFNSYITFPPKQCSYTNCSSPAYHESIGLQIPDGIPKRLPEGDKVRKELIESATAILSNGTALDRLVVFIKTKIIPIYSTFAVDNIIRHHARLTLSKLSIKEKEELDAGEIESILIEFNIITK